MQIMKLFLLMVGLVPSKSAFGCELDKKSTWYWDTDQLVENTNRIVVAKLVKKNSSKNGDDVLKPDLPLSGASGGSSFTKWTFKVEKVLKGKSDKGEFSFSTIKSSKKEKLDLGTCAPILSFKVGTSYLIFVDSFHPQGYQQFSKVDPKLIEKITASGSK